ncbi:MAG: M14 metallopeptidase family protein [Thermomicrobiales bacterium]
MVQGVNGARATIRSPQEVFGYVPGEARKLPSWAQVVGYFRSLAASSDRVRFEELGPATEGQPFVALAIAAPETLANLDHFRDIQRRLADPRSTSPDEAEALIAEGKTVVLLTCSIHSTEVGSTLMALSLAHELATGDDEQTRTILDNVILLLVPSLNPDGWQLVYEWYTKTLDTPHEGTAPPTLYHTYTGHDNNRDWFMFTQQETRYAIEWLHNRWHPQIVFDQHQMGSEGARFFVPPYIDPYDPNVDPILQQEINQLGYAMVADLTAAGKTGVATAIIFDAFSPSRAYQHYHGGVRILSEAASAKICTPITIPKENLREARGFNPRLASTNHPLPWPGGEWTIADIVAYERVATYALLNNAARGRDRWLRNFYLVHKAAVERASPHAFVLPAGQRDPGATDELLQALQFGGVEIERATAPFTADGVRYDAGARVIRLAQPYGPFAKTLLETQHYPDLRLYPGGPPKPPYDITAQTLGLQFGVETVQIEHSFEAELVPETPEALAATPARVVGSGGSGGETAVIGVIGAEANASVRAINALFAEGKASVSRLPTELAVAGEVFGPGSYLVEGLDAAALAQLAGSMACGWGWRAATQSSRAAGAAPPARGPLPLLSPERDGRGLDPLRARTLRLRVRHAARPRGAAGWAARAIRLHHPGAPGRKGDPGRQQPREYPAEFSGGIGDQGAAHLRRFVEEGGTLIALDAACELAIEHLYLPVTNALASVKSDQFYAPGALFRIIVDPDHPLGWGFERDVAALYLNGPAFDISSVAGREQPTAVARYPLSSPLLSGWVLGPGHIAGKAAIVRPRSGAGARSSSASVPSSARRCADVSLAVQRDLPELPGMKSVSQRR